MIEVKRPTEDPEKTGRSVLATQKPWWIKYANCLETELTQLRNEVEQYKWLLKQAKTLRRDNMILRKAIEAHRRNVWGEVDADHDQDIELYKALDSIDNSSQDVSEDLA